MIFKTEFRIEGLNPEGEWHTIAVVLVQDDLLEHRDHVIKTMREMAITRYSKVRLVKYVTTIEVIGEDIPV